jgi:hypothetical protein
MNILKLNNNHHKCLIPNEGTKKYSPHNTNNIKNPVVIIHQNRSISSNVNDNDTATPIKDVDQIELKYAKGYVNVLKERFTRKSLDNDNSNVQRKWMSSTNVSSNDNNQNYNYHRYNNNINTNLKLKIINDNLNRANNRHSVCIPNDHSSIESNNNKIKPSPTTTTTTTTVIPTSHFLDLYKQYENNNKVVNIPLSSSTSTSSSLNNRIKQTSLSMDHLNHQQQNEDDQLSLSHNDMIQALKQKQRQYDSKKQLDNNSNLLVKCTYLNGINKDELPRPNFVSSVKSLFEKKVIPIQELETTTVINNKSTKSKFNTDSLINEKTFNSNSKPPLNPSSLSSSLATKNAALIDNLVGSLCQNGTLVYEHTSPKQAKKSCCTIELKSLFFNLKNKTKN